ncbi:MAG: glycosyltransferase family 2 protein [Thermoleophilia bacterium]
MGRPQSGPFLLAEVELDDPPAPIRLAPHQDGIGLLARRSGRPVAFALADLPRGAVLAPEEVARMAAGAGAGDAPAEAAPVAADATPLTLAVCTHDRPELLRQCLEGMTRAVAADAAAGGHPAPEILVVDNAPSGPGTADLVAGVPGVRYAMEPRAGLDFARNRALAEARGDVVVFIDDDAVADRGWVTGIRHALARHPDAAAVTGLVLPFELETEAQIAFERRGGFRKGFRAIRYEGDEHEGNAVFPCGSGAFGVGCNMAVRREHVLAIGGFDEALDTGRPLPGGGDLDIFYRVIRTGGALVYEPRMLVFHTHRRTLKQLRRQYWTWGLGFAAFAHKTLRTDPPMRGRMLRTLRWWLGYQARELRASVARGSRVHPAMPAADLAGGLVGILLTYPRSVRRSARIRREVPEAAPPP